MPNVPETRLSQPQGAETVAAASEPNASAMPPVTAPGAS
jgi:hypothetical protein